MTRTPHRHRPAQTGSRMQFATATLSTTLVLLLLGLVTFFVLTARHLTVYMREHINFAVELDRGTAPAEVMRLQKQLAAQPFVRETAYVSPEQALREQSEAMGADPQEFLGYNPFPPTLEIRLNARYANPDSIARIERLLKAHHPGIRHIVYRKELVEAIHRHMRHINLALLALAGVLGLISFALINNTIRLTVYSQRFLIHTMTLVGASWSFIRRPFLARHFRMGLLAAFVADALLWGAAWAAVTRYPQLVSLLTPWSLAVVSAVVLAAGLLLTWACALTSINKFLRMRADELCRI